MLSRLLFLFLFLIPSAGASTAIPFKDYLCQLELEDANSPSLLVLKLFEEMSHFYRPSGEEAGVRNWLLQKAQESGTPAEVDAIGNVIVSVPATGTFANQRLPSVAIQGHLDMVLNTKADDSGHQPQNDVVFKNGVPALEVKDGWLQSVGNRTTIGADNGLGVAIAMRYMIDKSLPHPPLRLIFTVDEETHTTGAAGLKIPDDVHALINLDGEEFGVVHNGCQGCTTVDVRHKEMPAVKIPRLHRPFRIRMTGFKGGHSGIVIGEGRANSVLLASELLRRIVSQIPNSFVTAIDTVGDNEPRFNTIPNFLSIEVAVPPSTEERLDLIAHKFALEVMNRFRSIEPGPISLQVEPLTTLVERGVDERAVATLTYYVSKIPSGQVESTLSSNSAFLTVRDNDRGSFDAHYGFMPRAFSTSDLEKFAHAQVQFIRGVPLAAQVNTARISPAWTPKTRYWLLDALKTVASRVSGQNFKTVPALGFLEVGYFAHQRPELAQIAFGPTILNAHEPTEMANLADTAKTVAVMDQLLVEVGNHFKSSGKPGRKP